MHLQTPVFCVRGNDQRLAHLTESFHLIGTAILNLVLFAPLLLATVVVSSPSLSAETVTFTHPSSNNGRDQYLRALTCYLVNQVAGTPSETCLTSSEGFFETKNLPEQATESLRASMIGNTNFFDFEKLGNWSNTWSYALRNRRTQVAVISDTLEQFKNSTQYKSWPREIILRSTAKQKTRVIYRSPMPLPFGLSVAETYESVTGDLTAPLIETEVAMDRTDGSGNADFYSYNSTGQLSTTSLFPGGPRQVPGFCMGCHYSVETKTFERAIP